MIVHVAISCGWTLDYVSDHIDLPKLETLNKYWRRFPPMHVLLNWYTGYKAPSEVKKLTAEEQAAQMEQLMATAPKYVFVPPKPKKQDGN